MLWLHVRGSWLCLACDQCCDSTWSWALGAGPCWLSAPCSRTERSMLFLFFLVFIISFFVWIQYPIYAILAYLCTSVFCLLFFTMNFVWTFLLVDCGLILCSVWCGVSYHGPTVRSSSSVLFLLLFGWCVSGMFVSFFVLSFCLFSEKSSTNLNGSVCAAFLLGTFILYLLKLLLIYIMPINKLWHLPCH